MKESSKESYINQFVKRSIVLNPLLTPKDSKQISKSQNRAIMGISGLRNYYDELLHNITVKGELKLSRINYAKLQLKEAKADWKRFNDAQMNPAEKATSHFAEAIFKAEAKLLVLEKESRKISKILKDADAKEAEKKEAEAKARQNNLHNSTTGKMTDGRLSMMGGMPVHQDKNGVNVFADGSLVSTYVEEKKAERLEYYEKKEVEELRQYKIAEKLAEAQL